MPCGCDATLGPHCREPGTEQRAPAAPRPALTTVDLLERRVRSGPGGPPGPLRIGLRLPAAVAQCGISTGASGEATATDAFSSAPVGADPLSPAWQADVIALGTSGGASGNDPFSPPTVAADPFSSAAGTGNV